MRGYSPTKNINYFDLGTHHHANELIWIDEEILSKVPNPKRIFAFEANAKSYKIALGNTQSIKALIFFNIALVNKIPESGKVRLYTSEIGIDDSIYRVSKNSFVDVPAKRLSDVIKNNDINLSESINVLRMNIEGCEFDVIQDLFENDLVKYFDGFYGMWDDVSKIDSKMDEKFRALLKEAKVHPFPFNGRDMKYDFRKNLIKKRLNNSIMGTK
jgi:FkbM family methyltransferase